MSSSDSPPDSNHASSMDFTSPYAPVIAHDVTHVRPLGLTVTGVLCTLGGIIGTMTGLMALGQLFLAETLANAFSFGEGGMVEAQKEMQQQMQAITNTFFIPSLLSILAMLALSIALLVGGIGLLRDRARARILLRKVFIAAIILELCRAVLQSLVQVRMVPVMESYMKKLSSGGEGPGGSDAMAQFASIGIIIGIVFWLGWAVIKIGLLIWGRVYLNRPHVVEYLSSKQA